MFNLYEGCQLVKYNPIYAFADLPFCNSKPVGQPVVRWKWYQLQFKNIAPHVR